MATPVGPIVVTAGAAGVSQVSWVRPDVPAVGDVPARSTGADDGLTNTALTDRGLTEAVLTDHALTEAVLTEAVTQLTEYFAGTRREFSVPVDLAAVAPTARQVLVALQQVSYGTTVTYGELAELSGTGLPARAIGSVMGANPVPILIPCHRVLAGDGLGGYSGGLPGQGLETKRWLLELEGVLQSRLW